MLTLNATLDWMSEDVFPISAAAVAELDGRRYDISAAGNSSISSDGIDVSLDCVPADNESSGQDDHENNNAFALHTNVMARLRNGWPMVHVHSTASYGASGLLLSFSEDFSDSTYAIQVHVTCCVQLVTSDLPILLLISHFLLTTWCCPRPVRHTAPRCAAGS